MEKIVEKCSIETAPAAAADKVWGLSRVGGRDGTADSICFLITTSVLNEIIPFLCFYTHKCILCFYIHKCILIH